MRLKYLDWDIVTAEVPDEITLAINLTQCPNKCPGCHSPRLREDTGRELTWESLNYLVGRVARDITCVCFMGGDLHPDDVAWLAHLIKIDFKNIKTAWYSGNSEFPSYDIAKNFDYIKVGPYKQEYGPLNSKTTNQRMYKLSFPYNEKEKKLEFKKKDITNRFWK